MWNVMDTFDFYMREYQNNNILNMITEQQCINIYTVERRYNDVLGTMKITLLYPVSHYSR